MPYNVILVVIDSLRKDHVGCYGGIARTPNIDALAKESVIYEDAYPESLPTIPVRRGLYTGKRIFPFVPSGRFAKGFPNVFMFGWEPLRDEDVTLSEVFKLKGYRTALIGDNYHLFEPGMNFNRGFDEWIFVRGQEWDKYRSAALVSEEEVRSHLTPALKGTGVERLVRHYLSNVKFRRSEEDWFAPSTFREGARWLEENAKQQNFFLALEPFDPHEPWDPPQEFVDMYDPGYSGVNVITPKYGTADYLTPAELKHMRANYAGEVTLVDKWFGIFMQKFYELGLDKNTVLAVISDHGHQLGEHNLTGKVASGLYPELLDIPLLIRAPNATNSGERVSGYVYNHDLFVTLISMAGLRVNAGELSYKPDGINAWDLAESNKGAARDHATSAFMNYLMYRDDEYWMITDRKGNDVRLYDISNDKKMERDISIQAPDVVRGLYSRIASDAGGTIPEIPAPPESIRNWYEKLYLRLKLFFPCSKRMSA